MRVAEEHRIGLAGEVARVNFPAFRGCEAETLAEIRRVLTPAGRLVILPVAFPSNGFLKWLYKVTGETPEELDNALKERVQQAFEKAGFEMEAQVKETKESRLVILLARV